jgi:WD40 repeat protein
MLPSRPTVPSSSRGSYDGTARTWEVATGKPLVTFAGHDSAVYAVAFSPDGTLVVSGVLDETARVWEAATGRERVVLAEHGGTDADATVVPDGTMT